MSIKPQNMKQTVKIFDHESKRRWTPIISCKQLIELRNREDSDKDNDKKHYNDKGNY